MDYSSMLPSRETSVSSVSTDPGPQGCRTLPATGEPRFVARKGFRANIAQMIAQHQAALQERRNTLMHEINAIDEELGDLAPLYQHLARFLPEIPEAP